MPVRLWGGRRHLAVEHLIAIGEGQAQIVVGAPDMDGHQAPPAIRRRRARRSITAADVRISAVRLASCSMREAACRRSAAWWGSSRIKTESARARSLFASPRISSGPICGAGLLLVLASVT